MKDLFLIRLRTVHFGKMLRCTFAKEDFDRRVVDGGRDFFETLRIADENNV